MQYYLVKVDWDSAFFGFPIGELVLPPASIIERASFELSAVGFELVYIFSTELIGETIGTKPVDRKIIFKKDLKPIRSSFISTLFNSDIHNYNSLLKLAYLSGSYSRFKLDTNFPEGSFLRLYKRWLDRSIANKNEFVILSLAGGQIAGFVSLEIINETKAAIGLIAVYPDFQGQGIGSGLLKMAEEKAVEMGAGIMEVATQEANLQAMSLYLKNDYTIKEKTYIYHCWNK